MNLTQLSIKYNTKEKCIAHLEKVRWGDTPACLLCGSIKVSRRTKGIRWHCNDCNRDYSVLYETIFEHSRLALPKWYQLISLMLNAKKGISAMQISRDIGVTYKTAWRMGQQIRILMAKADGFGEMQGHVEIDEAYIGGYRPGKPGHATTRPSCSA